MRRGRIESFLRRTEPLQTALIAVAFWTLAVMALTNLRDLHLWGMPQVEGVIARATMACMVILVGLVGIRHLMAWRKSGSGIPVLSALGGMPGVLLFGAVASYLAIGVAVMDKADWQPDTAQSLKFAVLCFGLLVSAAVGARALLERIGADRLLRGVLAVLNSTCILILASPVLRDLGVMPHYRIPFRLTGTFEEPNVASFVTCMTVALAAAFLTNGGPRTLGCLGLVAGVAASLGTASRTAVVVLGAMAVVFLLINVRSKPRAFVLAWAGTGMVGIAAFVGVVGFSGGFSEWSRLRVGADAFDGELFYCPSSADSPGTDCAVLLAAKDILAGDVDLNWSRTVPVNRWQGVTVDGPEGRVTGLNLGGLGLNGRIPAGLGRLDRLVSLRLNRNRLTGPVPPELGELTSLEHLVLAFNALSGPIPPELGKLENLEELWLRNNRLTGSVPAALGDLDLSVLRLSGNDFDSIPPELTAVASHDLARALLCRPLPPTSPALFDDCAVLLAAKDALVGDAPLNWNAEIPVGSWDGVTVAGPQERVAGLALFGRGLTGRIPPELGRLDGLVSLNLAGNRLAGPIPPELGRLADLRDLSLDRNALTGAVPAELGRLPRLRSLWLRENLLTGSVPPALWEVPEHDLGHLALCLPPPQASPALYSDCALLLEAKDMLAGDGPLNWNEAVPVGEWRGVTLGGPEGRVIALELPRTRLNGRIPAALGNLAGLRSLVLDGNALTGPIPPELGKLTDLETLGLAANDLTGPIPLELAELLSLRELWLSGNRLTGSLPPELRAVAGREAPCLAAPADNPGLRADCALLLAARNTLAGDAHLNWSEHVPIESWQGVTVGGSLERVTRIELGESGLNGRIPSALGRLSRLVTLNLSSNRLTGGIPPALGELNRLVSLRLNRNRLTGPVPPELGELTDLEVLVLSVNALSGPIPPELGELSQLGELWLRDNRLSGSVPPELDRLGELSLLRLSGNDLDRPYPRHLYRIDNHDLDLDDPNHPRSLGDAEAVQTAVRRANRDRPDEVRRLFCRRSSGIVSEMQADCALLLASRDVLAGDAPLNWSEDIPVEFWQGVTVGGSPPRVTALELPRAGLNGRIPSELGELNGLVALNLSRNRLAGPIPPGLGGLERLVSLRLERNRLTGSAPTELDGLDNLSILRLAGNDLDRPFPPKLREIADHDFFDIPVFCRPGKSDPALLADCALLLNMRDALAGDAPLNWSRDTPVDDWLGVAADRSRGRVTALELTQMGLNGRIPAALGQLDGLVSLRLDRNRLVGTIPPELGNLADLRMLALNGNLLVGPVPPELGKLSRLTDLWLHGNRLSGPAPPSVAALPELAALRLDDDDVAGEMPTRDHGHGRVLDRNQLCPSLLEALPRLHDDCATLLDVRDMLAGDVELNWSDAVPIGYWRGVTVGIPPAAGEAVEGPRVIALDLSHMELNGRIPAELSALDGLASLRLGDNRLTGSIPPELGSLTGLRTLVLENNALTGAIPPELGALQRLVALRLGNNELSGRTWQFTTLTNLRVLALENNVLLGNINPRLGNLSHLEELRLENNRLHGRIPEELDRLTRLAVLRLGGNAFGDCVPAMARAARTRHNDLDSADLLCEPSPWGKPPLFEDGARLMRMRDVLAGDAALNWSYALPVASWQGVAIGGSGHVYWLDLRDSGLTGRIPPELGELRRVWALLLDGNRLTGPIPPELGKLSRLEILSLGDNRLTGPIPPEIADLSNLGQLWLADNRLTGAVPRELAGINRLSLAVAGNEFNSCLPHELHRLHSHDSDHSLMCTVLAQDRPLLWRLGFQKAIEAPVFGHGLRTLNHLDGAPITHAGELPNPHNLYLTFLGEAGIVPLLLFLSAIVLLLRAQRTAPQSLTRDATAAWVFAIALYSMSYSSLLGVGAFMFLAGLSIAIGAAHDGGGHRLATA